MQFETELTRASFFQKIVAAIPDDDPTGAIFALRDDAFEGAIFQGVVLHGDSEPLNTGFEGWTFGHSPGLQDTVHLKAEVKMVGGSPMLVDDEQWRVARLPPFVDCRPVDIYTFPWARTRVWDRPPFGSELKIRSD